MRIDGSNIDTVVKPVQVENMRVQSHIQEQKAVEKHVEEKIREGKIEPDFTTQLMSAKRGELPISEKIIVEAIERANKAIIGSKREFRYSIHEPTNEVMIKVLNSDNGEVVREIPPEKILDLVAKLCELAGVLVDERR